MRLLIVEDDTMLGATMQHALEQAGHDVVWVTTANEGLAAARRKGCDAIILDLALPPADGLDLLRTLRREENGTPVIIVTAQDRVARRIEGLDAGADDYLVKPFDLDELLARVRVQDRQQNGPKDGVVSVGDVSVDVEARLVTKEGNLVVLTAKEFRVLSELIARVGQFVSKSDLEASLYDDLAQPDSNTVEVAIYGLRRKLGSDLILTARGLGYMIERAV